MFVRMSGLVAIGLTEQSEFWPTTFIPNNGEMVIDTADTSTVDTGNSIQTAEYTGS